MHFPFKILFAFFVAAFAFFPLTDSDIWWHLASARDFFENGLAEKDPFCWTPSRTPWINVHLFFQWIVYAVHSVAGAFGLVLLKSVAWGIVAFLWVLPCKRKIRLFEFSLAVLCAFIFRYALECRPIFLSLLFLGIFWNLLPQLLPPISKKYFLSAAILLFTQWIWIRTQGLFSLSCGLSAMAIFLSWNRMTKKSKIFSSCFLVILFSVPLWHFQGNYLFAYPFGLLDRLMGGSAASQIFALEIAENRAPSTLLLLHENTASMATLLLLVGIAAFFILKKKCSMEIWRIAWLLIAAFLAVFAERNLTIFFFPFVLLILWNPSFILLLRKIFLKIFPQKKAEFGNVIFIFAILILSFSAGSFLRSLPAYFEGKNFQAISQERVPMNAVIYLQNHPLLPNQNLFNDDRSGGYISWKIPAQKTFADGRFILKDSTFMANYLNFAKNPEAFFVAADSLQIYRALMPTRYISLWKNLDSAMQKKSDWKNVYRDDAYTIWDKTISAK